MSFLQLWYVHNFSGSISPPPPPPPPPPLASDEPYCPFFPNLDRGHTHGISTFSEPRALPRSRGLALCTKKISGPLLNSSPQKKTLESTSNFLHKTYFLNMIFSINFTLKSWVFPSQLRIFFLECLLIFKT